MRLAITLLILAGCIDSQLVPCGDRVCAVGSQCVAGRTCATDEELTACRDLDEGAPCTSTTHDGYCFDGVCVEDLCGDETMQVGEVCDDGNRQSGDGCSADCRSTEVCGNAIVDPGEFCDCGDGSMTAPLGCRGPNDDDPAAVCDTTCTRRCGDELVTGSESCDGSVVPRACTDLGYYEGTTSCTPFCAIDDTGCSGRCGDDIAQVLYGEECDGAAALTTTCVSFGRDYGVLGCSNVCLPAIGRDCHQYGWQLLLSFEEPISSVAANLHGALGLSTSNVRVIWDSTLSERTNSSAWTAAAANSTTFVAYGPSSIGVFTGTTWTVVPASVPAGPSVLGDDGLLYTVGNACGFTRTDPATGASTTLTAVPASTCNSFVAGSATRLVVGTNLGVWIWDGVWTQFLSGTTKVRAAMRDHVTAAGPGGFVDLDLGQASVTVSGPQVRPGIGLRFDTTWDGDWLDVDYDGLEFALIMTGKTFSSPFPFPPGGITETTQSRGDGALVAWGTGIYRFGPTQLRLGLFFGSGISTELAFVSDALVLYGKGMRWIVRGAPFASSSIPWDITTLGTAYDLIGDPRGTHIVLTSTGIFRFDTNANQYVYERAAGNAKQIAGSLTDAIVADGATVELMIGGAWSTVLLPSGCSSPANEVAGDDITRLYVAVSCNSVAKVLRWNGVDWTEYFSTSLVTNLTRLTMSPEGTLFANGVGGVSRLDPPSTLIPIGPVASRIVAVSATDVYMQAGGGYMLYDGTRTTAVRLGNGAFAANARELATYSLDAFGGLDIYSRMPSTTTGF